MKLVLLFIACLFSASSWAAGSPTITRKVIEEHPVPGTDQLLPERSSP